MWRRNHVRRALQHVCGGRAGAATASSAGATATASSAGATATAIAAASGATRLGQHLRAHPDREYLHRGLSLWDCAPKHLCYQLFAAH
jgi:hypothetical protein